MSQQPIAVAEKFFLHPSKLDQTYLSRVITNLTGKSIDYADLYFQATSSELWCLEDGIVKSGNYSTSSGVGIRATSGDKSGLAFSENITTHAIEEACVAASSIATSTANANSTNTNNPTGVHITPSATMASIAFRHNLGHSLYDLDNPISSITDDKKVVLLKNIDQIARTMDSRITQVNASLASNYEIILIATSDGNYTADIRPLIRLNINVIAKQQDRLEQGTSGGGGRFASYKLFLDDDCALAKQYIEKAVGLAITNLQAIPSPAGNMPVVLGPGWPGVLIHESIGHGLEGDAIRKGASAFSDKLGKKVASDLCTIVDHGCIESRRGSLNIDDEGTPTQNTVLIENGILKNFMQDKLNAKLMQQKSTGNSRRQSYAYLPIPRMTNTYMQTGTSNPQDIIKSVANGIYAVNFAGGQVDVTSGKFVFEANEAYLINNGVIQEPLKGATLIGDGPEILKKITMVGNDLQLDTGIGTCGKDGQTVPVGVGQPTLLINELTVGGTKC
jgi:TldD protein